MHPASHRSAQLKQPSIRIKSPRPNHPRPEPRSRSYYPANYGIPDYAVGFIPSQHHKRPARVYSAHKNFYPPPRGYPNYRSTSSDAIYPPPDTSSNYRHFGSDSSPYFQGAVNGSAVALLGFLYLLNQAQVNRLFYNNIVSFFSRRRPSPLLLPTLSKKLGTVGELKVDLSHRPVEKVGLGRHHWVFPAAGGRALSRLQQPQVRGIEAQHAIGLLGLLLFINLLRVTTSQVLQF